MPRACRSGSRASAVAERAYQRALAWSRERMQGRVVGGSGAKTSPHRPAPDVKRMLLTMKSLTEAMRALAYWTSALLDRARKHGDEAEGSAARRWSTC
jgi:acyl-CoA dehydrogenase